MWMLAFDAQALADARVYYVDSIQGNDKNSGTAATASASDGPWQSLARLAAAKLNPGDRVVLACQSVWRETLQVAGSGVRGKPITVSAPASGCTTGPTIDGSIEIPAAAWRAQAGMLLTAPLAQEPFQLDGGSNHWLPAHHPNLGYDKNNPQSHYLPMAADGDVVASGGRQRGTSMRMNPAAGPAAAGSVLGAKVHIRTNSWALETRRISTTQDNNLVFDTPTVYPAQAGWGYFLSGAAWMVDSPGEWHYDATAQRVLAHWPGAKPPDAPLLATVLPIGVDLRDRAHIDVQGLTVRRVGTGLQASGSRSVRFAALAVEDVAGVGVAGSNSQGLTIEGTRFLRTGLDAIQGVGETGKEAVDMVVRNNTIRESGVRMRGDNNISLPVRSYAAVYAGPRAVIESNTIQYTGYIGIRFMPDSRVQDNVVEDTCLVLNDCGAIYTWGVAANNSQVLRNVVLRSRGNLDGTRAGTHTAAQGIYLDDNTTGVTVAGNTVTEADHGIQVHIAQRNKLQDNVLFNNRRSQLWMQANANAVHPDGDVVDNEVIGNQLAATAPGSVALLLHSSWGSTAQFGKFKRNRYVENSAGTVVSERTAKQQRDFSWTQWQASEGVASTLPPDSDGFSLGSLPYAMFTIAGGNLVRNGALDDGTAGWSSWNPSGTKGALLRADCTRGTCLRYQAGSTPGTLSSPSFALQQGQWYRLAVDLLADSDAQPVRPVVRRAGGRVNGDASRFEGLTDRTWATSAGSTWQRKVFIFKAAKSAVPENLPQGNPGARLDFEALAAGRSLTLAQLEVVPLAPNPTGAGGVAAMVNKRAEATALPCPLPAGQAHACAWMHKLSDGKRVDWPLQMAPHSSALLYALDPALRDADHDGVADPQDRCPGTRRADAVNAAGCALGQP